MENEKSRGDSSRPVAPNKILPPSCLSAPLCMNNLKLSLKENGNPKIPIVNL